MKEAYYKPEYLNPKYADRFQYRSMAEAYHNRVPYSSESYNFLISLISDTPKNVLDVGCGTGDIALNIIDKVSRVDAIDFSENMIEVGKRYLNGDHPNLSWIVGKIENATLYPPYSLITCGTSLHWFDLNLVFPIFKNCLSPNAYLAILTNYRDIPWRLAERKVLYKYSTIRDFQSYNLIDQIVKQGFFNKIGEKLTTPILFKQSIDNYIESYHSKERFCKEIMGKNNVKEFGNELRQILLPYNTNGIISFEVTSKILWGYPL